MKKERIVFLVVLLLAGTAAFFAGRKSMPAPVEKPVVVSSAGNDVKEKRAGTGNFTNPLLDCECRQPTALFNAGFLEEDIQKYLNEVKQSGQATHVSVYFRDLNNGPWFGIDEDENFRPASLFKVPLMIAVLKKGETDPAFLAKKIPFKAYQEKKYGAGLDTGLIVPGRSYTVSDLLTSMIVHSDNEAADLLGREIGSAYDSLFSDLQIVVKTKSSSDYEVSVKEYSSFFRILYNASYLSRQNSETALKILNQATFKDGLIAGLPPDMVVAHKYGRWGQIDNEMAQLHDCGIVYYDHSPYVLCVMTRGRDFDVLGKVIAHISSLVYHNIREAQ